MKKRAYSHPQMTVYEVEVAQLLAVSDYEEIEMKKCKTDQFD